MSKYGFDIDGTLTRTSIARLANELFQAGHEIHVITGALRDEGMWTISARELQLKDLGVRYTELHRCFGDSLERIGAEKAKVCAGLGLVMMFEDSSTYIRHIGGKTLCCFVVNNPRNLSPAGT